jgi:hypothetical protein
MKIKSSKHGEYPFGTHWTPGEIREVSPVTAENAPPWLSVVTEKPKKRAKAKAPAPVAEGGEG